MLLFGLRLGNDPRAVVTTMPKPIDILIGPGENGRRAGLLKDPTVTTTRASTYENRDYLPEAFFRQIVSRYEGTRLGRQELDAGVAREVRPALAVA